MLETLHPSAQATQLTRQPIEPSAPLVEIFSAIQGEGLNVGTRQIFVRFGGCDLRCRFCDSAHTWHPSATCAIERSPGSRVFDHYPNPVAMGQLLDWVSQQHLPGLHDSISLTGGEPLLQAEFLKNFLPKVRDRIQLPIYLETGGHRPTELQAVLPYLDLVGMDLKLPSVSGETHWQAHQDFLSFCYHSGTEVFCKLIISQTTQATDLEQAAQLVAQISADIPVILQPVTPLAPALSSTANCLPPLPEQVLDWQALMKKWLSSVRVIPQTHKAIGQL
jgi:7-carboxy-7-deazaguanine synthase